MEQSFQDELVVDDLIDVGGNWSIYSVQVVLGAMVWEGGLVCCGVHSVKFN